MKAISKGDNPSLKFTSEKKQKDIVEKRKGGKKKLEKPLTKKAKSDTSHKEAKKGDKFSQQIEEKEVLNESLAEKGEASSKDERSEKTSEKPKEERESFEKSPTISEGEKKVTDIVEKRTASKKKPEKPLTKKTKRDTSHEQAGKGDKSTRKSGDKEVLHESLAEKGEASN